MPAQPLIPAAEYVRMSTDDQPNSIPFQIEAIKRYAAKAGFEVVATYSDPGRSGVEIKHRPGLRQLIQDVVGGHAQYRIILVYDVSRWGRFQDVPLQERALLAVGYRRSPISSDAVDPCCSP